MGANNIGDCRLAGGGRDVTDESAISINADELFVLIGQQTLQIARLQRRIASLQAPKPKANDVTEEDDAKERATTP